VSAALGSLRNDEIATTGNRRFGMAHLAAHRADEHVVFVQVIDRVARHTETRNEDSCTPFDHGADAFLDLARKGGQQIDAEGLGSNRLDARHFIDEFGRLHGRCTEGSDSTGLGNCSDEFAVRHAAHARKHDGVLDVEEFGDSCAHGAKLHQ
jgi:hypothetical protein